MVSTRILDLHSLGLPVRILLIFSPQPKLLHPHSQNFCCCSPNLLINNVLFSLYQSDCQAGRMLSNDVLGLADHAWLLFHLSAIAIVDTEVTEWGIVCGNFMVCPWRVHGVSMECLCDHGNSMERLWYVHGTSMTCPWCVHGDSVAAP